MLAGLDPGAGSSPFVVTQDPPDADGFQQYEVRSDERIALALGRRGYTASTLRYLIRAFAKAYGFRAGLRVHASKRPSKI
jgi:predicted RNA-binding protein YlqC (UPF0109 family)